MTATATPKTEEANLPVGTSPENAKLHRRIERVCYVLLVGLVIEGVLTLPGMLLYYGWPTLSLHQICDQLQRVVYSDDSQTCETMPLYGPPFGGKPIGEGATTTKDGGTIVQPKPDYERVGWRELVKLYEESEARNQAKAEAEKKDEQASDEADASAR